MKYIKAATIAVLGVVVACGGAGEGSVTQTLPDASTSDRGSDVEDDSLPEPGSGERTPRNGSKSRAGVYSDSESARERAQEDRLRENQEHQLEPFIPAGEEDRERSESPR